MRYESDAMSQCRAFGFRVSVGGQTSLAASRVCQTIGPPYDSTSTYARREEDADGELMVPWGTAQSQPLSLCTYFVKSKFSLAKFF